MIQVHVDLAVDPAKEQQMLQYFNNDFRNAANQFEGFVSVDMLKLREAFYGKAPEGVNYRFVIVYRSEELRRKWIASDIHQEVWGGMEKTLSNSDYNVLLFDVPAS